MPVKERGKSANCRKDTREEKKREPFLASLISHTLHEQFLHAINNQSIQIHSYVGDDREACNLLKLDSLEQRLIAIYEICNVTADTMKLIFS